MLVAATNEEMFTREVVNVGYLRVLYVDASPASAEAQAVLGIAGLSSQIIFVEHPECEGKSVPRLLASEGFFDTLEGIHWYASAYGKVAGRSP